MVVEIEAQEARRRATETEEAAKSEHQKQEMLAQAAEKKARENALESRRRALEAEAAAQSTAEALDVPQKKHGAVSSQGEAASARAGGQEAQRDHGAASSIENFTRVQKRELESARTEQKRQKKQQRKLQDCAAADAVRQERNEQARATRDAHENDRQEVQFKQDEVHQLIDESRATGRLRRRREEMKQEVMLAQENQK